MVLTQENVFDNFLYLRIKYKKTQEQVIKGSNVSKATISGIESGAKRGQKIQKAVIFKLNQYFEKLGE